MTEMKEYTVREKGLDLYTVVTDEPEKHLRNLMSSLVNDRSAHSIAVRRHLTDEQLEDLELSIEREGELLFLMWSDGSRIIRS